MSLNRKVRRALIGLAAGLLAGRRLRHKSVSSQDLYRKSFRTSTQRMGVRFTEGIRDTFRRRWLRRRP